MSLDVAPGLLDQAMRGDVDEASFVATVRTSLPYAYDLIAGLSARLREGGIPFADNQVPPATEAERGQLLRALASDAIRASLDVASVCGSPSPELPPRRGLPARRRPRRPPALHVSARSAAQPVTGAAQLLTAPARLRPSQVRCGRDAACRDNGRSRTGGVLPIRTHEGLPSLGGRGIAGTALHC